ncbi:MAG TPA: septal ring lytic transglycosylase RlpA family protein [Leptolyngbyaceae cyanobacterium]
MAIPCAILKLKLRSAIYNVSMKKRLLSTTAALLTAALGIPLCHAESTNAVNPFKENSKKVSTETKSTPEAANVVKVGEYQSTAATKTVDTVIARIQPHQNSDRQLVTLYVHNIPVMTFSSSDKTKTSSTKVGATQDKIAATDGVKVASNGNLPDINSVNTQTSAGTDASQASKDPVWQATAVAAKLNQMSLDNVDGSKITVSWKGSKDSAANKAAERYSIKVKNVELVEINASTRLPEQTKNLAEDALQVTNRLRRLLDNAQPLSKVAGMPQPKLPKPPQNIALGPVRFSLSGLASWYGPGFHGRRSANGEIYNQNALTAAHKSLPFGTRVRVTNKHSGRSVVVRINDRGPYIGGRVIDLSAAAARTIGVIRTGTAPVIVEVLGR